MTKTNKRKLSVFASAFALLGGLVIIAPTAVNATPTQFTLVSPIANQKINLGAKDKWYLPIVVNSISSGQPSFQFTGIFYDSTGHPVLQSTWSLNYKSPKSGAVSWTFKLGLSNLAYVERPVANYLAVQPILNNFAEVTALSSAYSNQALKQGTYSFELWAMNVANENSPSLVADIVGLQVGKPNGVPCSPGSYSATGTWTVSKPCVQTSLGYVAATPGSKKQSPVLAGTQGNVRGLTVGTPCSEGNFQPRNGQARCIQSNLGNYVPGQGAKAELKCPIGRYAPNRESFSCQPAEPGTFVPSEGQSRSIPCPAGMFQTSFGAQHCQLAPKGSFVQGEGSISALLCPPGKYSNVLGSIECTNAPAGSYAYGPASEGGGATLANVYLCSAGTYTNNAGSSYCVEADYGYYVSTSGAVSQTACPPTKTTLSRRSISPNDCSVDLPSL